MSLVLRLNEVLFKPLFLKVLDWAIGSGVHTHSHAYIYLAFELTSPSGQES